MYAAVRATKSTITSVLLSTCYMKILTGNMVKIVCQAGHTGGNGNKQKEHGENMRMA